MKQAITGLAPPEVAEAPLMTIWPSIGAWAPGRFVGRLVAVRTGVGFFSLGKLFALATIPVSLSVYLWRLMPFRARRYTLSSRRIVVRRGLRPVDERSIGLDEFDAIQVDILPGQQWLRAGDLVFRRDGQEVFRLPGVSQPEPFRETCLKARTALITVREVLRSQNAANAS